MTPEIITKDFCADKTLFFNHITADESEFIQRSLFKLGFNWAGGTNKVAARSETVAEGLTLKAGHIYYGHNRSDTRTFCSSEQFDPPFSQSPFCKKSGASVRQNSFNQISTQMKAPTNEGAALRHLEKDEIKFSRIVF
jgi:hypothetical protein